MSGPDRDDFNRILSPFEGKLIRLRAIEEEDLPRINEGIWDAEVSRNLSMAWPQSVAETRGWWDRARASDDDQVFVIETLAGELVGSVGLHGINGRNRSAELGIWLARPHWNKGYGTDAVRTACRFAIREMNLLRVTLLVYETNPGGIRAYEKVGFKEQGRYRNGQFVDGRHVDAIIMDLEAQDLTEG